MYIAKTQDGYEINIPITFNNYRFIKYIGCGSTCIVVLVENDENHGKFSAKIMSKKDIENRKLLDSVTNEINILKELDHPHIIKIYDTFDIKNDSEEYYVIIMEYCENGDLLTYALNHSFKDEKQKKRIIFEFLDATKYLHKKGISHGDIKSENVLLDANFSAKLCDFGFVRTKVRAGNEAKKGTLYYAAPELFIQGEFDPKKADIWAIGITLYSLFKLTFPFKNGNQNAIIKQIMSGRLVISKNIDMNIRKIVENCTQVDASSRPTIEDILSDEYFNEVQFDKQFDNNACIKQESA